MKRSDFFTPGFAARLHKEAADRLFGDHSQPLKIESAAGKVGTAKDAAQPKAATKKPTAARSVAPRGKLPDPRQGRFKL